MTVYYKFCGGCNPVYDRTEMAERIQRDYPQIRFTSDPEEEADASVIFCGCPSACADLTDACTPCGRIVVWGSSSYDELRTFLGGIA